MALQETYTVSQVVDITHISKKTIYSDVKKGLIKFFYVGENNGKMRFTEDSINEYIKLKQQMGKDSITTSPQEKQRLRTSVEQLKPIDRKALYKKRLTDVKKVS